MKLMSTLLSFFVLFVAISFAQYPYPNEYTILVSSLGTDSNYCGAGSVGCRTVAGAFESFKYQIPSYIYGTYPFLTIQFGPDYIWSDGISQPVSLNRMNVSFVGSPDGSTFFVNTYYQNPLFFINTTYEYQYSFVTFTNITFGTSSKTCPSPSTSSSNLPASFIEINANYYSPVITINFNNFTSACAYSSINLISVIGSVLSSSNTPAQDYTNYVSSYAFTSSPFFEFNFNNLSIIGSGGVTIFSVPLFNSTLAPVRVNIENSNITGILDFYQSLFLIGRGNLNVKNSTFNILYSYLSSYIFQVENVGVEMKNSNFSLQGGDGGLLTCQGCFFNAKNINVTSDISNPVFYFNNGAASFYNSILVSTTSNTIISAEDAQLSLRNNKIYSKYSQAIQLNGVDLAIYYNTLVWSDGSQWYQNTEDKIVKCSDSKQSTVIGDQYSLTLVMDCDKYQSIAETKWAFIFIATGIVGIIFCYAFLRISRAIIVRCGGGNEPHHHHKYNKFNSK